MTSNQLKLHLPEELAARAVILNNIGSAIAHNGARETAVAMMCRAIATNPFDPQYRENLAAILATDGESEQARKLIAGIMKESDKRPNAWNILAYCNTIDGDLEESIACNKRALELAPHSAKFQFDLACSYLRTGRFAEGWPLYEARSKVDRLPDPPPLPQWKGERCKHLLVYGDQGVGDKIMFARFLPWARERCDKLTFATDPASLPLFYGYRGTADLTCENLFVGCEAQIPVASLAGLYGADADNLPPDPGLIEVPPTRGTLIGDGIKVGLCWAGNPKQANDDTRSMPFREIVGLAANPRNDLFSLQVGPRSVDIATNRAQLVVNDMTGMIEGNWSATPAMIKSCDVIVTVCTSIAHLAGALGVPCFLMLSRFSCWRWMWDREDTPWYPSVRIFRQKRLNDWKPVIADVMDALDVMHKMRAERIAAAASDIRTCIPRVNVPGQGMVYEPDVTAAIRNVLRPGDTAIDVGACIGLHTALMSDLVGESGRVIAFEPGLNNQQALHKTAGKNVTIIDRPVWNTQASVDFFHGQHGDSNALWDPAHWPGIDRRVSVIECSEPVTMSATTLDAEALFLGLDAVKLIKIDTEGAEQHILEGAAQLLNTIKPPFIIAELHEWGLYQLGRSQRGLRTLMERHGYSTFILFADGSLPQLVPSGTQIRTGLITNLLFSTQEAIGEYWPVQSIESDKLRPMYAYGRPVEQSSAA